MYAWEKKLGASALAVLVILVAVVIHVGQHTHHLGAKLVLAAQTMDYTQEDFKLLASSELASDQCPRTLDQLMERFPQTNREDWTPSVAWNVPSWVYLSESAVTVTVPFGVVTDLYGNYAQVVHPGQPFRLTLVSAFEWICVHRVSNADDPHHVEAKQLLLEAAPAVKAGLVDTCPQSPEEMAQLTNTMASDWTRWNDKLGIGWSFTPQDSTALEIPRGVFYDSLTGTYGPGPTGPAKLNSVAGTWMCPPIISPFFPN